MSHYQLQIRLDREFDSINRVLNKFCGRGFRVYEVDVQPDKTSTDAVLRISLECDVESLRIITKKLITYLDVHQLIELSEIKQLRVV